MDSADAEFPDEHTFAMPAPWRRVLRRRRGGIHGPPVTLDDGAAARVREWTEDAAARTARALADPLSDQELADQVRACLDGRPSPRGAAMLAHVLDAADADDRTDVDDHAAFADAWASAYGLAFAAEAAAELCAVGVDVWWPGVNRRQRQWRLCPRPTGQHVFFLDPIAVRTTRGITVPDLAPGDGRTALRPHAGTRPDRLGAALDTALTTLAEAAHRGLRHLTPGVHARIEETAADLSRVGLTASAAEVTAFLTACRTGTNPETMVRTWVDAQLRLMTTAELR